jgi:hypothetical protein
MFGFATLDLCLQEPAGRLQETGNRLFQRIQAVYYKSADTSPFAAPRYVALSWN